MAIASVRARRAADDVRTYMYIERGKPNEDKICDRLCAVRVLVSYRCDGMKCGQCVKHVVHLNYKQILSR